MLFFIFILFITIRKWNVIKITITITNIYKIVLVWWIFIIGLFCLAIEQYFNNFKVENAISLFVGLTSFLLTLIIALINNHNNKENIQMQLLFAEKIELINKLTQCIDLFDVMYNDPDLDKHNSPFVIVFNKFLFILKYFKEDMATFHITFSKTSQKILKLRKKFYTPYDYRKEDLSHKVWKGLISAIFITEIDRDNYKDEKIEVWKNNMEKEEISLQYDDILKYLSNLSEKSEVNEVWRHIMTFQDFMKSLSDLIKILEEEMEENRTLKI